MFRNCSSWETYFVGDAVPDCPTSYSGNYNWYWAITDPNNSILGVLSADDPKILTTKTLPKHQTRNIHYTEGNYSETIKYIEWYWTRFHKKKKNVFNVCCNIKNSFANFLKYCDTIHNYEAAMSFSPDHQTDFNTLLCYVVLGLFCSVLYI